MLRLLCGGGSDEMVSGLALALLSSAGPLPGSVVLTMLVSMPHLDTGACVQFAGFTKSGLFVSQNSEFAVTSVIWEWT